MKQRLVTKATVSKAFLPDDFRLKENATYQKKRNFFDDHFRVRGLIRTLLKKQFSIHWDTQDSNGAMFMELNMLNIPGYCDRPAVVVFGFLEGADIALLDVFVLA